MHTESLGRIINLLKGRPNIKVYHRDYLGKIRNSKIHDCQPILENYRDCLLNNYMHLYLEFSINIALLTSDSLIAIVYWNGFFENNIDMSV